jgi:hypothetical protein
MLARRRERLARRGPAVAARGHLPGELPHWLDVDGFGRGFMALLDGLLLQRIEAGEPIDRRNRCGGPNAILDVLLAVRGVERLAVATA